MNLFLSDQMFFSLSLKKFLMSIGLLSAAIIHVYAQAEIKIPAVRDSISIKHSIIFFEDTVGYLSSVIGAFTAEERAERINRRLSDLLDTK